MTSRGLAARSPLESVELVDGVAEIPFLTQINLRADTADVDAMARIRATLGVSPPADPNTFTTSPDGVQIIWLGPDEWLITRAPGMASRLEASLREAVGDDTGSVVDVSASRTTLSIVGTDACTSLERGCPIDLHPRRFGVGSCAQTILARVNVILLQMSDAPEYRILVRSSLAAYLAIWLRDAVEGERG